MAPNAETNPVVAPTIKDHCRHKLYQVEKGESWKPATSKNDNGACTVVDEVRNNQAEWWARILFPHESFRMDACVILDLLDRKYVKGTQPWKMDYFCKYWMDFYSPSIKDHHDNEELLYMPYINNLPGCHIEDKVSADHEEIMKLMGKVNEAVTEWQTGKVDRNSEVEVENFVFERLLPAMQTYQHEMLEHIAEEESTYPRMVRDHGTEKSEQAVIDQIIKRGGLSAPGNALELPWFLDAMVRWAGPEATEEFRKESIPAPVRMLNDNFWAPNYRNYWRPLLFSLALDEDPKLSLNSPRTYGMCNIL
eukprot:Clim_evm2s50 gene=Clim_evmTU2s50